MTHPIQTALTALAVDASLGGVWIKSRVSPVRTRVLDSLTTALGRPVRKLHPAISDDALFGALDFTQTLATGKLTQTQGALDNPDQTLILTMAERASASLAAKLSTCLDRGEGHILIALDEGNEDESLPPKLADRLAFHFDLNNELPSQFALTEINLGKINTARAQLAKVSSTKEHSQTLVATALTCGITHPAIPLMALKAARALAAYAGQATVSDTELTEASSLIYAPRATALHQPDTPEQYDQPEPAEPNEETARSKQQSETLEDRILNATEAALPKGLLDALIAGSKRRMALSGGGQGAAQKSNRRGRPISPKRGKPGNGNRVDLVTTLRNAAPWQTIRPKGAGAVTIWPNDIAISQYESKSDRVVIFAVDASGSAAIARLSEAKGAIETLLADAYSRRDHVALIAFRGTGADLLLPPTRSLVQAKRRLAALPGGGGTPLATGLKASLDLALLTRSRGFTPGLVLITDGSGNIALSGEAGRPQAAEDATQLAKILGAQDFPILTLDSGRRPAPSLASLAATMGSAYVPMPHHRTAQSLSDTVNHTMGAV